ncbi:MAG: hypothetical protein IT209_03670 [Armatimonadetes bacterium]|nr:hypothetical protein [Armatimonadota bacterium]
MEASSALKFLRLVVWIAPVLAIAWVLLADLMDRTQDGRREPLTPLLLFGCAAVALTLAAAWAVSAAVHKGAEDTVLWPNILAGGACALAGAALVGHIHRRQLESSASAGAPRAQSDAAILAVAIPVSLAGYLISKSGARPDAWLSAAPLGSAAFVSLFVLAARAQRRASPGSALPLRLSGPLEMLAAVCAVVALSMLVGRLLRFDEQLIKHAGDVVAMSLAVGLLLWLPLSVIQRTLAPRCLIFPIGASVIYTSVGAWLFGLVAKANLLGSPVSQCLQVGLAAGIVLALMSTAGLFHRESGYSAQANAIALVVIASALALCLRLLAGFGVAACAGGMVAAVPVWALLTPWRTKSELGAEHAFPASLVWGAGFLACVAALRIWLSLNDATSINIFSSYPLLGMIIGLSLPFVVWSLSAGRNEDAVSPGGTALALFGSVVGWLVVVGAIAGVAVVLREPAVRLFLFGLGASGLAGLAVAGAVREEWTSAPVVSTALLSSLLTVTCARALMDISAEASRPEKVKALAVIFGAVIVFYLLLEIWRTLALRQRTTAIIVEEP